MVCLRYVFPIAISSKFHCSYQGFLQETEERLETDLRPETLEQNLNHLLALHRERDQAVQKEMERLESLQRIADKVENEAKRNDIFLDEIKPRIDEGANRLDRLSPRDAKHRCDIVTSQPADVEEAVKMMFSHVQALADENYNKTPDVQKRVQRIHQRFISARNLFQNRLLSLMSSVMNTDANRSFQLSMEPKQLEIDNHFHFFFIEFPMSSHLFAFGQLRPTLDRSKP